MNKLLVIGDVIDDIIVVPETEIRTNTDTNATIQQTLGGSASNVASWAANQKADVTFVGSISRTDIERVTNQFELYGVKTDLQASDKNTGSLVVIVEGANRSMLTDRGANQDLNLEAITENQLATYKYVYLSGYSILNKTVEQVQSFITKVHTAGSVLIVDPGSTGFIKDYGISKFRDAIQNVAGAIADSLNLTINQISAMYKANSTSATQIVQRVAKIDAVSNALSNQFPPSTIIKSF